MNKIALMQQAIAARKGKKSKKAKKPIEGSAAEERTESKVAEQQEDANGKGDATDTSKKKPFWMKSNRSV